MHEFITPRTSSDKRKRNADDLDRFLAIALNCGRHLAAGDVAGPFALGASPKLYVGKVRTLSPFK